jgi:hypothetical protein
MEQKKAVMRSVIRRKESASFSDVGDNSNVKNLRVLLVNDEFFILMMLQQIVQAAGITKIDQA